MDSATQSQAAQALKAHGQAIDDLHAVLASQPGVDNERLQQAVDRYKSAHQKFTDDALGCMN